MARLVREIASTALMVVLTVAALEGACRIAGRPYGDFEVFFRDGQLYPPNQRLEMTWGPIPYVVETNNHGFRGEDFSQEKPPGGLRILTLGDSITDGFFVDNPATWQPILQTDLEQRLGRPVEVINGARGGGSIDKQRAMLEASVELVQPDLVLLTFVSNDLAEIEGKTLETLLERKVKRRHVPRRERLQRFLMTRVALGEFVFDTSLRWRSDSYRQRGEREEIRFDDERYAIEGGDRFEANAADFLERFTATDGLVLEETFAATTDATFDHYRSVLERFAETCRRADAELLLAYFPAYSQVYDPAAPLTINERLRALTHELDIGFLDLTDGFREAGRGRVLHLAPLDYHLNPAGNQVLAEVFASHLETRPLARRAPAP